MSTLCEQIYVLQAKLDLSQYHLDGHTAGFSISHISGVLGPETEHTNQLPTHRASGR